MDVVEPDVAELLPKLIWHMDEPTADPAIMTAYLVCREARKHATVLLVVVRHGEKTGNHLLVGSRPGRQGSKQCHRAELRRDLFAQTDIQQKRQSSGYREQGIMAWAK